MTLFISLFLILNCLYITYQDYKERKVLLLSLISCGILAHTQLSITTQFLYIEIFFNLVLVGLILGILYLYSHLRKINLREGIGIGDILFFVVIALGHTITTFIALLCSSLLFALFIHCIGLLFFKRNKSYQIPLAGHQALLLALFYSYQLGFSP